MDRYLLVLVTGRRINDTRGSQRKLRGRSPRRVCTTGYKYFIQKGDLKKANEHYNEKNAAGAWVKAVPPEGDPVEFIKVSRGPGSGGGYRMVKAPGSA